MFGIGFTELLLIAIVAILFLGPDKLPQAMMDIAKFIKGVKKTISDAQSSLEEELKIADLKEEALKYKQQLDDASSELKNFKNINFDNFDDLVSNDGSDDKIPKESPKAISSKANVDDPYAKAPVKSKVEPEGPLSSQVESKNDTVTFKKKKKSDISDEPTDTKKSDA